MDDLALLQAWREGHATAGHELFERHFESVRRFFMNKAADAVEDLVQRTFLATVEGRDRFRGGSSFRTYLFGVAHNVLRKHARERGRDRDVELSAVTAHDLGPSPSSVAAKRLREHQMVAALRKIPLDLQVALELFYWEQLESNEIAEVLDIPHGTVRSRLRRGRDLLARQLQRSSGRGWNEEATATGLQTWARALREHSGEPGTE